MKRIGVTQRVDVVEAYGERRDCLDQKWAGLLSGLKLLPVLIPNAIEKLDDFVEAYRLDGVLLTGGNDIADLPEPANPAPERDGSEAVLVRYCIERSLPILGVCRGMHFLVSYFGGELIKIDGHVRMRHDLSFASWWPWRTACNEKVNSFHNWGVSEENLPACLEVGAWSADGLVEAFRHVDLPILGIMWHPEREDPFSEADKIIISNHFWSDS